MDKSLGTAGREVHSRASTPTKEGRWLATEVIWFDDDARSLSGPIDSRRRITGGSTWDEGNKGKGSLALAIWDVLCLDCKFREW